MGYNSCRDEFTAGQFKRMKSQFNKYRVVEEEEEEEE